MPDVTIAAVLRNGVDNRLDGVDLIGPHHQELLLTCDQNHIAAYRLAERAFSEEGLGEAVEVDNLLVVYIGELVDRQEALFGIEGEMTRIVVCKIKCLIAIADYEELKETQDRLCIPISGIVLVFDDLLHSPARAYAERFQLDLNDRHAVDEQNDIVPMMAIVRVDAELVNHLKRVLAPVPDVDERVVERRAVVAYEAISFTKDAGSSEDVGSDDVINETSVFGVGKTNAIKRFKFLSKISF